MAANIRVSGCGLAWLILVRANSITDQSEGSILLRPREFLSHMLQNDLSKSHQRISMKEK